VNEPNARRRPMPRRILVRIALIFGAGLTVVLALVIVGAFMTDFPILGVFGAALSGAAPWIGVALLVALAVSIVLVVRSRRTGRIIIAAIAALALVGSIVVTTEQVSVATDRGLSINPFAPIAASRHPDHIEQYSSYKGDPLEVSIWTPTTGDKGTAPVAFFTHGGGWVSGDPSLDLAGLFTTMADQGWVIVSAEYTLATPTLHTSDFVEAQIGCAMAWTGVNAATYGGDPSTFLSMGESAGGNLAINSAYRANSGNLGCPETGPLPEVDAVVTLFPGVNPSGLWEDPIAGGAVPGRTFMQQYIGGSPEEFPERYAAVNSATHIYPTSPPTLIFQGENDHLVQAPRVYDFVEKAQAAGVDVELIRVPFGEHGFPLLPLGAQLYTNITLDWLHDQGLAP
jgi:acetyl esterase